MTRTSAFHVLPIVALGLICVPGCENKAAKDAAEYREDFHLLVTKLEQANLGYRPRARQPADPNEDIDRYMAQLDLQTYRQELLDQVGIDLSKLTRKYASHVAGQRLLADVYASGARNQIRKAILAWTELGNESTVLLGQLMAVSRAGARAKLFDIDMSPLLADLHVQQRRLSGELGDLSDQAANRTNAIELATTKIDSLVGQRDQALEQAQAYRDQGFKKKSEQERFELHLKATESQRAADATNVQAERLDVRVKVDHSSLDIIEKKIELRHNGVRKINDQIAQTQESQANARRQRDKALTSQTALIDELAKEFDRLHRTYADRVETPFTEAGSKLDQSINILEQAVRRADRDHRRSVQLDLLGKLVDKMFLLSEQIHATDGYGYTLFMVVQRGREQMPERVGGFVSTVQKLKQSQDELIEQATEAMAKASELADGLRSGELESLVTQYEEQIKAYDQRIQDRDLEEFAEQP